MITRSVHAIQAPGSEPVGREGATGFNLDCLDSLRGFIEHIHFIPKYAGARSAGSLNSGSRRNELVSFGCPASPPQG